MMQSLNIGLEFHRVARDHSEFPAILSPEETVTYKQLWNLTENLAKVFIGSGVDSTSTVALATTDARVSLGTLLATATIGCRFVIAGKTLAKSAAVKPTHLFKTEGIETPKNAKFSTLTASEITKNINCDIPASVTCTGSLDLEAPWLYLHTSGTTGAAKYMALSQQVVLDRTKAIERDFEFAATTMATLFGVTSRPFFARALGALLNGGAIVASHDISFWYDVGVDYVCGSPGQASHFFEALTPLPRKLNRIEVSGAKISDELVANLLQHFETVIDIYGASETNKTYATEYSFEQSGAVKKVGRMLDSEIEIRSESGAICGSGEIGQVFIRNPYMASHYVAQPEASNQAFQNGWFFPGDYAKWDENGTLSIVGRQDDVVSVGGQKINANLVDLVIRLTPGVLDAISFGNPKPEAGNELVAFIQIEPLVVRSDCLNKVREMLQAKLGFGVPVNNLHSIDKVPRDIDGQPMRSACAALLLEMANNLKTKAKS